MPRILSLLPSTTEIIYLLGAEASLVGVTHECDFPRETAGLPRVTSARIHPEMSSETIDAMVREQLDATGTLYALDMELVRRLRPDIVLTQQLCTVCAVGYETVRAAMRSLESPPEVINIEPRTLSEVLDSIVEIGKMLAVRDRAELEVARLRKRLDEIPALSPPPRVLLLEWLIPPFSAGHWMPDLVEAAGGIAVLAHQGEHSRGLDWPAIEESEFDHLVISCCGFDVERAMRDVESSTELSELLDRRPELPVTVFDGNHYFSRPGPRLVESAELLHAALEGKGPEEVASTIEAPFRHFSGPIRA